MEVGLAGMGVGAEAGAGAEAEGAGGGRVVGGSLAGMVVAGGVGEVEGVMGVVGREGHSHTRACGRTHGQVL